MFLTPRAPLNGTLAVSVGSVTLPGKGGRPKSVQTRLGPIAACATSTALASVLRAKSRAVVVASCLTAAAALVTSRSNAVAAAVAACAARVAAEATAAATAFEREVTNAAA